MRAKAIKATTNWLKFGVLATIGLIFALVAQSAITVPATAAAPVACADAGTTQSSITVTPSHGKVFYIDSGQGQNIDASYVGYKVVAGAAKTNLWMKLDTFTGGTVSLANAADASTQLGDIANAGTETGFFLLKAATSSASAQSHVVRVYTGNPSLAGATEIFSCTFTFLKVKETIKAAANKISSNFPTVTNSGIVGGNLVVTVEGATGTIGSGTSSPDGKSLWFSPAAKSSWPTSSLRLVTTSIELFTNASMGSNQLFLAQTDNLRVTTAQLGAETRLYYRAIYTFKIIGRSATPASVIPIAQISSGTQIKHTDVGSFTAPSVDTSTATVNAALSKSASTTSVISGSDTIYSYTLTASNKGAAAVIDEIVDTPASGLTYVAGSARWNGAATTEPALSVADPTKLIFPGPFSLAAGTVGTPTTRTLTYQLKIATCSPGTFSYVNTASAKIGSLIIGSDPASISKTTASGTCGSTTVQVANTTEVIPVEVTTEPASGIGNTVATLNGTIDPNGQSGLPVFIEWGTSASLASFTSVQLAAATTTATVSYAVSTSLSGLSTGTVYYYRVRVGSTYGQIVSFVTTEPIAAPTVTTGSAIAISGSSNQNDWKATLVGTVDPNQTAATVFFSWGVDSSSGACTNVAWNTAVRATTDIDGTTANLDPILSAFPVEISSLDMASSLTRNAFYCYRISATYVSGGNTLTVTGSPSSFKTIIVANQTITFAQPADSTVGSTVNLGATATSSLTVTYVSNTPLVCTVVGNVVTIVGGGTCSITANQAGDINYYAAPSVTQTFLVAKQNQEIVFADMAKNYGDADFTAGAVSNKATTTTGTNLPINYSSIEATCPATVAVVTAGGSIQVVGIGTCVITAHQHGDDSWNAAVDVSATLTVSAKALTVSISANHKEYDRTDAATLTSPSLVGVLPADVANVSLGGSATGVFSDATVANGKTVTLTSNFTISGTKSGNYTLTQPGNPTANITRLAINVLVTANNKEYDGTDAATLGVPSLSGVIAGDSANVGLVTTGVTAVKFSNASVANTKPVTLTGSYALSGTASGNYSLVQPSGLTANITPITLTVTGLTGVNKYYDGNTNATYTGGALSGVLTDDTLLVTLVGTPTASFATSGASVNPKTITFNGNFSLTGTKAGNYLLTQPSPISALISKASQTITFAGPTGGFVGDTKAPLATASSDLDPTFTVSGPCTYDAGTNTITTTGVGTCTVVASQIGDDNFNAAPTVTRTFEIAAVPVNKLNQTITFSSVIKTYGDIHFEPGASSNSDLPITYSIDVASCPAAVATLIAGEIHIVGVGTCVVKANQVGSASYNPATEVLGTITINPAVLTIVNIVVEHKVYDATRGATFSGQALSGRVLSHTSTDVDIDAASLPTALFNDENVGNAKPVVFGNFVITGGKSGNYTLTQPGPFTANITKANQTITFATPDPLDVGASRTLAPTASSNLPVTLTSNTTAKCSVAGLAVTGVAAGDCDLEANQPGNGNYNPASPVVRRMTINAATVINNGGGNGNNGNNGNGNGNVTPPVTPTPTPSPTVSATPTPVATPRVTPTPRATPRATVTPAPFATVTATPAPRVTPNVVAAPTPTPSATAPAMAAITELLEVVKKAIDKIVTASAAPSPSTSETGSGSTTVETKLVEEETVTTTKTNGSTTETLKSANKTIAEASAEKITGFAKGAGVRIEVIGSRITGQFVVAPGNAADVVAVAKAIEESTARTATAFASINDVTRVTQPAKTEIYNSAVTKTQEQIFEASGLAKPVTLSSLNVTSATKWIQVTAQANTYLPGTMVYLTVTTQPIIFGEAVVDKFGRAKLVGKLPIDILEQGGHSLRIVGIRSLKGIGTDANGEIVLSQSAMDEIQLFDDGTQATVIFSGKASSGGDQTVVREIPLDREISWWTVWLALIAGLITLVIRVVRPPVMATRRLITTVVALAAGVPAAVLGWTEIAYELWIGVGIALVFGLFNLFWKRGREKRQ